MDATQLYTHKEALREMIKDAVERRDCKQLEAISTAVYDLELLVTESFWDLDQLAKGTKQPPKSQAARRLLSLFEQIARVFSVFMMSNGVSLAWQAARIRSQMKGVPVPLEFEREHPTPLS